MNQDSLEVIRAMLHASAQAQLLLEGEQVLALSPSAPEAFPQAAEGASMDLTLGDHAALLRQFDHRGSLLFSMETPEGTWDVTAADCMGGILVTASRSEENHREIILRNLADQLRQPMTTLMAITPKLLPLLEEDSAAANKASEINRSLYCLLRLNRHIHLYGTPKEGLLLQFRQVELGDWLEELAGELQDLCRAAGVTLRYEGPGAPCFCRMDSATLRSAVLQLVSNAIKFSPPEGEIAITLRKNGERAIITVRDQGEGIPAGQISQVFRRMEQRGTIPDPQWGAGIGLPLAKRLVEAHGGRLMLESVEGEGTSAHVSLPLLGTRELSLRSPMQVPRVTEDFHPALVELADVLPSRLFDPRETE